MYPEHRILHVELLPEVYACTSVDVANYRKVGRAETATDDDCNNTTILFARRLQ